MTFTDTERKSLWEHVDHARAASTRFLVVFLVFGTLGIWVPLLACNALVMLWLGDDWSSMVPAYALVTKRSYRPCARRHNDPPHPS